MVRKLAVEILTRALYGHPPFPFLGKAILARIPIVSGRVGCKPACTIMDGCLGSDRGGDPRTGRAGRARAPEHEFGCRSWAIPHPGCQEGR